LESEENDVTSRQVTKMNPISHNLAQIDPDEARESLREVYYLVLLYLGEFLKNLL